MSGVLVIGSLVVLGLFIYLVAALFFPENF